MKQVCAVSGVEFEITPAERAFFEKLDLPLPTVCPRERFRRRLAWRNQCSLYQRQCDGTGESIISIHSPDKPYPVYSNRHWWSDGWDPLEYGREFDFSRSFFEQFHELQMAVPQLAIINDNGVGSENCLYCNDFAKSKDCHLVFGSWHLRDCLYSNNTNHARDLVDCSSVNIDCELAYECFECQHIYNCAFLRDSSNCSDCWFGLDLRGCRNCFGCVGLRQKQYWIFNEPHSKQEYEAKMAQINTGSYRELENMKRYWADFLKKFPRKSNNILQCEGCRGDYLINCKQCFDCVDLFRSEHTFHSERCDGAIWCSDIVNSGSPQWCHDCITPDDSYQVFYSTWVWKSKNVAYSDNCHSCHDLFGCVSLKRKQYCILNRQYSKEEYFELKEKIIAHMKSSITNDELPVRQAQGKRMTNQTRNSNIEIRKEQSTPTPEWGEFFPIKYSLFGYNETEAQDYFPLTKAEAKERGYRWEGREIDVETPCQGVSTDVNIPDDIADVADDILEQTLICARTGKSYRLQKSELAFYRKMKLPIPRLHWKARYDDRFAYRRPFLCERQCDACEKKVRSTYAQDSETKILCESCYAAVVQ